MVRLEVEYCFVCVKRRVTLWTGQRVAYVTQRIGFPELHFHLTLTGLTRTQNFASSSIILALVRAECPVISNMKGMFLV